MNQNALDRFGFSEEDLQGVMQKAKDEAENKSDRRICSCGHPIRNHKTTTGGDVSCKSGRLFCPCIDKHPVIKVPDTRFFMRKTTGNGAMHALSMGIYAAVQSDPGNADKLEWIIGDICEKCGNEGVRVYPTNLTRQGVVMDDPSEFSRLLCEDCRF